MLVAALALSSPAFADPEGWNRVKGTDEITGAQVEGAEFVQGPNTLALGCRVRDGAKTFIVRWKTDYHLGRSGKRTVDYRLDDAKPVTEVWDYTSRDATPAAEQLFLDPSRRFARRLVESKSPRLLFRLRSREGEPHDITVPLDDKARAMIAAALQQCS